MTPADDVDAGGEQPNPRFRLDDPRYRFVRRRLIAGASAILVAIWIVSLVSSGGTHPKARPAAKQTGTLPGGAQAAGSVSAAEQAREADAIQSSLTYTAYVTAGSASKREIALTFDDGQRHAVPATFFVI